MIELDHVTKDFGARRAVDDVSFTVRRGDIIGLLGPNGSGKTTILRMLTGFFPPTMGRTRVAGLDAAEQSLALRRIIGYLPENVVLYPDLRVRRFLAFCADVRRLSSAPRQRRLDAVLHDCGLVEVADRLIGTLSKGYRQRLGLAQALLHEPQVLILDEPTVGLDPRQVIEMRELIRALRGRTTVLLTTHILSEVGATCDRVVIIDRGRVVAEDCTDALVGRLADGERTLVRVAGPSAAVRRRLAEVPGVAAVEPYREAAIASAATDHADFVVHATGGAAMRQALAAAVVQDGWGLIEMRPLTASLEDMFVRLVSADQASLPP